MLRCISWDGPDSVCCVRGALGVLSEYLGLSQFSCLQEDSKDVLESVLLCSDFLSVVPSECIIVIGNSS